MKQAKSTPGNLGVRVRKTNGLAFRTFEGEQKKEQATFPLPIDSHRRFPTAS
jgi:hypothetical protein